MTRSKESWDMHFFQSVSPLAWISEPVAFNEIYAILCDERTTFNLWENTWDIYLMLTFLQNHLISTQLLVIYCQHITILYAIHFSKFFHSHFNNQLYFSLDEVNNILLSATIN